MGDVVQGDYRMSQMSTVLGATMLLNMRFVGFSVLPSCLAIRTWTQLHKVVLANGTIVNASTNSHSELYWALKGGTNNFGTPLPPLLPIPPTNQITHP